MLRVLSVKTDLTLIYVIFLINVLRFGQLFGETGSNNIRESNPNIVNSLFPSCFLH